MRRIGIYPTKWLIAFLASHMIGWLVANLQALWIVREIRKVKKSGDN